MSSQHISSQATSDQAVSAQYGSAQNLHRHYNGWQTIEQAKQLFLETPLVQGQNARAAVVVPARPAYAALARRIQAAIYEITGVRLPILRDVDLDPWHPPAQPLILLGNLTDNRLIAPLYARRKTFVDSRYPGKGGYVLQTVHDPWGTGNNTIILGGSDSRDVVQSVDRFPASLQIQGDTLYLPPLLDIKINQTVADSVPLLSQTPNDVFIEQQMAEAHEMLETGAHGGITDPLGKAGMYYAATGHTGWAELFKRLAYLMYEDFQKGREQYGGPWGMDADFRLHVMMPALALAETAPVFTDEDRLAITRIYAQFIEDAVPHAKDAVLHRRTRHNHWTYAALGLLHSAIYYQTYYGIAEADRWLYVADECFVPQCHSARSHENSNGYQWLTLGHAMEYALIRPYPAFFEEGHVRTICDLAIDSMDNLGYQTSYGDTREVYGWGTELPILAAAAWYYQEGRYQWALEKTGYTPRFRIGTGSLGGYRAELEPVEPVELTGAHSMPLDPTFHASFDGHEVLPLERAYDKVIFRKDFSPASEYLLLDGMAIGGHKHYDCNALIRLTALDRIWLADGDYYCSSPNFHNGVLPLAGGRSSAMPPFTWLDLVVDLPKAGFSRTTVKEYGGVDWERNILWRKGNYFLVIDALNARQDEAYDFRAMWHVLGEVQLENDTPSRLTVSQQDRRLTLTNLDGAAQSLHEDEYITADWSVYTHAEPVIKVLNQDRSRELQKGQRDFFLNLLQPHMVENEPLTAHRIDAGSILVEERGGLVWLGVKHSTNEETQSGMRDALQTDAALWAIGAGEVSLVQATHFTCGDLRFEAEYPVHLALDLDTLQGEIEAPRTALLRFKSIEANAVQVDDHRRAVGQEEGALTFSVPPGKHRFQILARESEQHNEQARSSELQSILLDIMQSAAPTISSGAIADAGSDPTPAAPTWQNLTDRAVSVLHPYTEGDAPMIVAGDATGQVTLLTADGTVEWQAQIEGEVTALVVSHAEDGSPLIVAGSSASKVTAFTATGAVAWDYAVPFYKRDGIVRVLLAADITGDGRKEVIAGAENWHFYTLDTQGQKLWQFESVHASSSGVVADLNNDGKLELIAATEYNWWFAVDRQGQKMWQHNTVLAMGATHVATMRQADGTRYTAFGCRDGSIQVVDAAGTLQYVFYTADTITGLAAADVNDDGIDELLATSAIQNTYCIDSAGEVVWRYRHATQPTHLQLANGDTTASLLIAEKSGAIQWLDATGDVVNQLSTGYTCADLTYLPTQNGGLVVSAPESGGVMGWHV